MLWCNFGIFCLWHINLTDSTTHLLTNKKQPNSLTFFKKISKIFSVCLSHTRGYGRDILYMWFMVLFFVWFWDLCFKFAFGREVYDNDFCFPENLKYREIICDKIYLKLNSCFYIKELWRWYVVKASNGLHVVSSNKNLIQYSNDL